ncbi:hypothetical protein M9458_039585, partial [Cirrhinus mrigala]
MVTLGLLCNKEYYSSECEKCIAIVYDVQRNHSFCLFFAISTLESPRLSTASVGSNDRATTATLSDSSDFTEVQRPVSVVSTISSGSGSSREDVLLSGTPSAGVPIDDNVDLELMPATDPDETQGTSLAQATLFFQQNSSNTVNNNNNSSSVSNGFSPFAANTMAPNPQLTYLDRVVMEIIETERMYVRDLR